MLTSIEWTATYHPILGTLPGYSFNSWWGCKKVSRACKHCYAETLGARWHKDDPHWGPGSTRLMQSEAYWKNPIAWNNYAKSLGIRLKVFCASMADVFEDHPDVILARERLWKLIEVTPYLNWLLLTKRPENIMQMVPAYWRKIFPDNVWIGTTVEEQKEDYRISVLVNIPAVVRFLSCEPLVDSLSIRKFLVPTNQLGMAVGNEPHYPLDWVIAGGESGNQAEPTHPDHFRELRDECITKNIPFFFKQWGEWTEHRLDTARKLKPVIYKGFVQDMCLVGKKEAGRLLDGREWNEMPEGIKIVA